jgi:hypothetical protein
MSTAKEVIMVKPLHFVFNIQAAEDNVFMKNNYRESVESLQHKAISEFNELVEKLRRAGVTVHQFEHSKETPDSVFPNNWFSTHRVECDSPSYLLYPMKSPNRRLEKENAAIRAFLDERYKLIDFAGKSSSSFEEEHKFLEGTGSLVLDRMNRIVYCCISQRSDPQIAKQWSDILNYRLITYSASYRNQPIYHTNVVMCVGTHFAIVCGEVIANVEERKNVFQALENNGKVVVDITADQMNNFCGNALELRTENGDLIVAMSSCAYNHLTEEQRNTILTEGHIKEIVHSDIEVIEKIGGGSVRCMIAELY